MVKEFFSKTRILVATIVLSFALLATGAAVFANNNKAVAATSCDKVNIIYCGVNKGNVTNDINAFKNVYNSNKSGHAASPTVKKDYTDIQAVYKWAGATSALVSGMNSSNTKLGTLYKDGHITVDGKTIATGAWVSARFTNGTGFTHITSNVYARKTTTSFAQNSAPVMVYMKDGKMVFGLMVDCGNAIKATPKEIPQPPKPEMKCDQLTISKKSDTEYNFTGKASVKNATIVGYNFNFGDGQSKDVTTSATSANTTYKYAKPGKYNIVLKVTFKADGKTQTLTSAACAGSVEIKPPETPKPEMSCDGLAFGTTDNKTFKFTAQASVKNATIVSYVFDFGDQKSDTVTTAATAANINHTYAQPGNYNAKVTVKVKDQTGKMYDVNGAKCAVSIKIQQPECKPGIPVGDERCKEECKPGIPVGDERCEEKPEMSCDQLIFTPNATNNKQYSFTVKASAKNAVIDGYIIDFGDGTPAYNGTSPSVDHAYAQPGNYDVKASVKVTTQGKQQIITSEKCAGKVTITPPEECKPGIPVGDERCKPEECKPGIPMGDARCVNECKPGIPMGDTRCEETPVPPTELPNTGAANAIGLFSGVSIAGTAAHRLYSRRRNS